MLYIFIHDIHVCKDTQQKRKTGFMLFSCKTSLNQISEACTNPRVQVLCVSLVEAFIYPKDWIGINSRLPPAILQRRKNHVIVDHCGLVRICIAKSAEILIFGWAMMDQNHEEYIRRYTWTTIWTTCSASCLCWHIIVYSMNPFQGVRTGIETHV